MLFFSLESALETAIDYSGPSINFCFIVQDLFVGKLPLNQCSSGSVHIGMDVLIRSLIPFWPTALSRVGPSAVRGPFRYRIVSVPVSMTETHFGTSGPVTLVPQEVSLISCGKADDRRNYKPLR